MNDTSTSATLVEKRTELKDKSFSVHPGKYDQSLYVSIIAATIVLGVLLTLSIAVAVVATCLHLHQWKKQCSTKSCTIRSSPSQ